jgi:hypothetical protein
MLRKAGVHSWDTVDAWPKAKVRKRRITHSKLKAPARQLPPMIRATIAAKRGMVTSADRESEAQYRIGRWLNKSNSSPDASLSQAGEAPNTKMEKKKSSLQTVDDTDSKLKGGLVAKVALKVMLPDGSVLLIRKTGAKAHAGVPLSCMLLIRRSVPMQSFVSRLCSFVMAVGRSTCTARREGLQKAVVGVLLEPDHLEPHCTSTDEDRQIHSSHATEAAIVDPDRSTTLPSPAQCVHHCAAQRVTTLRPPAVYHAASAAANCGLQDAPHQLY